MTGFGEGTAPRVDDVASLAVARQLDAANPLWVVVFGTYTRQFICFPLFDTPRRIILADSDPAALSARMRHIENATDDATGVGCLPAVGTRQQ
jgi:hypothetical protein